MLVLDACCGAMKIYNGYHTKLMENDELVSIDKRRGDFSYDSSNKVIVNPTIVADVRYLPIKEGCVDAINCDPPHLDLGTNYEKSYLFCKYGSWTIHETVRHVRSMNEEFKRVLKPNGFLFLKIMADRRNVYQELLRNFQFFLPIQVFRRIGNMNSPRLMDGALWLIGYRLDTPRRDPEVAVIPPEETVNPFLLFNSEKKESVKQ
jgi:SAM-dependent methyltransferase